VGDDVFLMATGEEGVGNVGARDCDARVRTHGGSVGDEIDEILDETMRVGRSGRKIKAGNTRCWRS
jgi:hypothetical protein